MGLCKCPKKKVTNLFCFEHRVNVCEHCLVANHAKCIVQSYLQWLQDSDYDPTCRLCGKTLADDSSGPCIRLVCYDVFHWSCLDEYARRLPPNTAPAGYSCPICKNGVFPPNNLASPVAETLKQMLSTVNWARTGLGLPLIDEPNKPESNKTSTTQSSNNIPAGSSQDGASVHTPGATVPSHSVISMDDPTLYARSTEKTTEQFHDHRKVFDSREQEKLLNMSHDHDEDKYKRRPALQWFARWFNSRSVKQKADPNASMKRCAVILVIAILAFLTLLVIFTRVGRASADKDPFLDPLANPNIRVQQAD